MSVKVNVKALCDGDTIKEKDGKLQVPGIASINTSIKTLTAAIENLQSSMNSVVSWQNNTAPVITSLTKNVETVTKDLNDIADDFTIQRNTDKTISAVYIKKTEIFFIAQGDACNVGDTGKYGNFWIQTSTEVTSAGVPFVLRLSTKDGYNINETYSGYIWRKTINESLHEYYYLSQISPTPDFGGKKITCQGLVYGGELDACILWRPLSSTDKNVYVGFTPENIKKYNIKQNNIRNGAVVREIQNK